MTSYRRTTETISTGQSKRSHPSPSQTALSEVENWSLVQDVATELQPTAQSMLHHTHDQLAASSSDARLQSTDPAKPSKSFTPAQLKRTAPGRSGAPPPPAAQNDFEKRGPQNSVAAPGEPKQRPTFSRGRLILAAACFPLTLYLLLGSGILYLLYCFEMAARRVFRFAASDRLMDEPDFAYSFRDSLVQRTRFYFYRRRPVRWHVRSLGLTLLFPLVAPLLAVVITCFLLWALIRSVGKVLHDATRALTHEVWQIVSGLFS